MDRRKKPIPVSSLTLCAAALVITTTATSGCTAHTVRPNRHNSAAVKQVSEIQLKTSMLTPQLNVDYRADELNLDIPVAAVTAAQIHAMTTSQKTSAATGLIGAYIGIQIARNAYESSLQKNANIPATPVIQCLSNSNFPAKTLTVVNDSVTRSLSSVFNVTKAGDNKPDQPELQTEFALSLSQDIASLHLRAEVSLSSPLSNRHSLPIYSREIDYYDDVITGSGDVPEETARQWSENQCRLFWERLLVSTNQLAELIAWDLTTDPAESTSSGKAIRFENQRGRFYERGEVLRIDADRLLIQTLRGGLLSVPGKLQTPDEAAP